MARDYYLPSNDDERARLLTALARDLPPLASQLRITPEEIARLQADARAFSWTMERLHGMRSHLQQWTAFKDQLRRGKPQPVTVPPAPPSGDVPDDFLPGVLTRLLRLVHCIKSAPAYTDSVGFRLGLIGPERPTDHTTARPRLKLRLAMGGQPEVCWKKRQFSGLVIEVDRGAGWEFLAQDTIPHYLDKFPPPKTGAVWKYRAMYIKDDARVGQWSDTASIAVGAGV